MSKLRFISIIAILLFLTNLAMLGWMFFGRPPHARPKEVIIEKLHFDQDQISKYEKLIQGHQSSIKSMEDTIRTLKNQLYQLLNVENNQSQKEGVMQELARAQIVIENIHFSHFEDLKSLCKGDQLKDFESLTKEIAALFSHRPPGNKKPE